MQGCYDYHKEYVLLDGENVMTGNTVRLAWCCDLTVVSVCVNIICIVYQLWISIIWNEKILCCASSKWTVSPAGKCSVIPEQVEIPSCLCHPAEFIHFFYLVIAWRLFGWKLMDSTNFSFASLAWGCRKLYVVLSCSFYCEYIHTVKSVICWEHLEF
jgi:hypothetical protein